MLQDGRGAYILIFMECWPGGEVVASVGPKLMLLSDVRVI